MLTYRLASTTAGIVVATVATAIAVVTTAREEDDNQQNNPAAATIVVIETHSSFLLVINIYLKQSVLRCFILHIMTMIEICDEKFSDSGNVEICSGNELLFFPVTTNIAEKTCYTVTVTKIENQSN